MRFQGKSRLAILSMMELATAKDRKLVTIADIAEHLKVSLSYLEQLFAELRRAGLVKGVRGPGGGYSVACGLDQISIYQIMEAVDDTSHRISVESDYPPGFMWNDLVDGFNTHLKALSLADLVNRQQSQTLFLGQNGREALAG